MTTTSHSQIDRLVTRVAARLPEPVARQFVKYAVVGGSNTAVDFLVYTTIVLLGGWYVAAKVVAAGAGMLNGYVHNRRWTFRAGAFRLRTLLRYAFVAVAGLALNLGLLVLLVEALHVHKILAQALVLPFVACVTFVANRRWTFRHALA